MRRVLALPARLADPTDPELRTHLDARLDTVEDRVGWVDDRASEVRDMVRESSSLIRALLDDVLRQTGDLDRRLAQVETRVTTDTQTMAEYAASIRRATERTQREVSGLRGQLLGVGDPMMGELIVRSANGDDAEADRELARLLVELVPGAADQVVAAHVGAPVERLGAGTASYLNWSASHEGPAAQSHVWFNPPVTVSHEPGRVRHDDVTERIVEVPYVLGVAAALPGGARVLDFGAAESTLALSMASLGLDVVAADLVDYPFRHPRLRAQVGPVQDWAGPDQPLDAVFCLSALEHVGLGAYGEAPATTGDGLDPDTDGLDRSIVRRFASWLRPGGELVLTAPYGAWEVTPTQRVYDAAHLEALLEGWRLLDRRVFVQTARDRWERAEAEPPAEVWAEGTRGVVLLRATPVAT